MKISYREICYVLVGLVITVTVYAYQSDQERTKEDITKLDKKYEKLERKVEQLSQK